MGILRCRQPVRALPGTMAPWPCAGSSPAARAARGGFSKAGGGWRQLEEGKAGTGGTGEDGSGPEAAAQQSRDAPAVPTWSPRCGCILHRLQVRHLQLRSPGSFPPSRNPVPVLCPRWPDPADARVFPTPGLGKPGAAAALAAIPAASQGCAGYRRSAKLSTFLVLSGAAGAKGPGSQHQDPAAGQSSGRPPTVPHGSCLALGTTGAARSPPGQKIHFWDTRGFTKSGQGHREVLLGLGYSAGAPSSVRLSVCLPARAQRARRVHSAR